MRAVAERLGSGTATLYRHFDSRAHLLECVVDRVLSEATEVSSAPAQGDWAAELRQVCHATFDALSRHRNVLPLLATQLPSGEHAIAGRERILAVLEGAGCPPELALVSYATLARYVLGIAIQLTNDLGDSIIEPIRATGSGAAARPVGSASAAEGVPLETEFAFGLDLLLAGLAEVIDQAPR